MVIIDTINKKFKKYNDAFFEKIHSFNKSKNAKTTVAKILYFSFQNYKKSRSNLWASSLTYYSLLSIVPIFAIAFSIAKGLGGGDLAKQEILRNFPLQPDSLDELIRFSDRLLESTKSGVIAGAGIIFLIWSIVKIFSLIEKSFNEIWNLKKERAVVRKITDYFAIVLLFPVVLLVSNGLLSTVRAYLMDNPISSHLLSAAPYLLIILFFTMIYLIIPNTKVKLQSALVSGIFAGILYNVVQNLLISSQVLLLNYNQIYGSFAVVPVFFIWQKLVWIIILLGSHISFILQNYSKFGYTVGEYQLSFKSKREILFAIIKIYVDNFKDENPPLNVTEVSNNIGVASGEINQLVNFLVDIEMLNELLTESEDRYFKINKNIEKLTVREFINIIETAGIDQKYSEEDGKLMEIVDKFNVQLDKNELDILIKDI